MSIVENKMARKRSVISFEDKIKILDRLKQGEKLSVVAKSQNLNESTIRTIQKNEEKIRKYVSIGSSSAKRSLCSIDVDIIKTEDALAIWIEDCINKRVPLGGNAIKQKALKIYKHLKNSQHTTSAPQPQSFSASKGWMENFKQRFSLHNIKLQGESASVDADAADRFTAELKKVIEDGGYTADQIFNAGETGLYWKKLPSRTYISKNQQFVPGFKIAKERITLLLCSNASGDCCMKPMVINQSMIPRLVKNGDTSQLPVYWRANKKALITTDMFSDWFKNCFVPDVENYLIKKNVSFKVLLVLDNAPGNPRVLEHSNVKIMFLPPNINSIIRPMDQGVISTFKAYYIRMSFQAILDNIESDENKTLTQAWKEFSILDSIKTISAAMSDLKPSTLNACWKALLPELVHENNVIPSIDTEYNRIITVGRALSGEGFDDMAAQDVDELFLEKTLDEEDLVELLRESNSNLMVMAQNCRSATVENLSIAEIQHGLNLAKKMELHFTRKDPCAARKTTFATELNKCIKPYQQMLQELQHMNQLSTCKHQDEPSSKKDIQLSQRRDITIAYLDDSSDED